jgi:pyridinium-3,5-biscarboxylic acid mononucleotide synthase
MDAARLRDLLRKVRAGEVELDQALEELKRLPFSELGFAKVDHHRALRQGVPEVILGEGKTPEQIAGVARAQIAAGHNVLVTRVTAAAASELLGLVPELRYAPAARVATYVTQPIVPQGVGKVAVVTAGTGDIPVAEEAMETLAMSGIPAERLFDVGVAGIHRLMAGLDLLMAAPAVIVVAGMEGALPSVVGGLVACPVIAVPTSIGYGVTFGGLTALLGMLATCAAGVTVVNIDNGFGAAMAIARLVAGSKRNVGAT